MRVRGSYQAIAPTPDTNYLRMILHMWPKGPRGMLIVVSLLQLVRYSIHDGAGLMTLAITDQLDHSMR